MDEPKKSTQFGPGNPGKPKGATNHITREIKEMVCEALESAGGVAYLAAKAESHPAAFLALVGRIVPLQVTGKLEHEHSGSLSAETAGFLAEVRALADQASSPAPLPH